MKRVEDASAERRVDWDREKASGHLVDVSGQPGRDVNTPGYQHVQGVPLTPAGAAERRRPAAVMRHVAETGRLPAPSTKVVAAAPPGGWPRFGPDGRIVTEGGST